MAINLFYFILDQKIIGLELEDHCIIIFMSSISHIVRAFPFKLIVPRVAPTIRDKCNVTFLLLGNV